MSNPNSYPFQDTIDGLQPPQLPHTLTTSSTTVIASPMVNPAPYSGSAEDCNGFLLQWSLALEMEPQQFPTEKAKVSFIISLLMGWALQLAERIWHQDSPVTREYLENLWEIPVLVSNCIICNKEIALLSGSNEHLLLTTYRQGLKPKLRLHLDAYDDAMGLEKFIQLSIIVACRVQGCMEH